jgi:hypothetical protein
MKLNLYSRSSSSSSETLYHSSRKVKLHSQPTIANERIREIVPRPTARGGENGVETRAAAPAETAEEHQPPRLLWCGF